MVARRALTLALVLNCAAAAHILAQSSEAHTERPRLRAAQRTSAVIIDGRIAEEAWLSAPAAADFRQQDPREGEPATQLTKVRILYDDEALYIAVSMFDDGDVRSRLSRRAEAA